MAESRYAGPERAIRRTTTLSVIVLAVIAALVSYKHIYLLVRRHGETSWTAAVLPISVDGMIAASSMSLLAASRLGQRSGVLPWVLLVIGSAASLTANVAAAEPSAVGRVIAAWPSAALIGSYELLMRQVRQVSTHGTSDKSATLYAAHTAMTADDAASYRSHTSPALESAASYGAPTTKQQPSDGSRGAQTVCVEQPPSDAYGEEISRRGAGGAVPTSEGRQSASVLRHQAWAWALANRTPSGELPSGKAIAERFGRRERWGRLVKQTGHIEGWS